MCMLSPEDFHGGVFSPGGARLLLSGSRSRKRNRLQEPQVFPLFLGFFPSSEERVGAIWKAQGPLILGPLCPGFFKKRTNENNGIHDASFQDRVPSSCVRACPAPRTWALATSPAKPCHGLREAVGV